MAKWKYVVMFLMMILGAPVLLTFAQTAVYELPGDSVYPEGVAYDPASGTFFVGSTSDGTIFQGDPASGAVSVFSAGGSNGRTTAVGMKVDATGLLWVAGGNSGKIYVYDTVTGDFITSLETPASNATFLNDVAVTSSGDVYFTDSLRPVLFKVSAPYDNPEQPIGKVEAWLDLNGTPIRYVPGGFNLNGIVVTDDDAYLIVVQSATGQLFRIDTATREAIEIDLGGETVLNGDGLVLDGQTLYVVRNADGIVTVVDLSSDFSSGTVSGQVRDATFKYPTTAALADGRLLVVNSQFGAQASGQAPSLPFTVSSVELP